MAQPDTHILMMTFTLDLQAQTVSFELNCAVPVSGGTQRVSKGTRQLDLAPTDLAVLLRPGRRTPVACARTRAVSQRCARLPVLRRTPAL